MAGHKKKRGIAYIRNDSIIHRLDPRTKLFALIAVSIGALMTDNPYAIGILVLFVFGCAAAPGVLRELVHAMRILIPVILITILIDVFFTAAKHSSGEILYSGDFWFLHLEATGDSVLFAASMALRIIAIGGCSFLFVMTTPYHSFVKSLALLGVPGIITFSLGYALRSVTSLSRDAASIVDAQRSRGLAFDRDLLLKRPHRLLAVFVPMVVSVMDRADQVSDAMQCRGYGLSGSPTMYRAPATAGRDYLALSIITAVVVLCLLCTWFFTHTGW